MHATGFEPVTSYWKTDYESVAFDPSAMHALFQKEFDRLHKKFLNFSLAVHRFHLFLMVASSVTIVDGSNGKVIQGKGIDGK